MIILVLCWPVELCSYVVSVAQILQGNQALTGTCYSEHQPTVHHSALVVVIIVNYCTTVLGECRDSLGCALCVTFR